jgi:glycosyltransferase involved in cell wall biosynthesis
MDKSKSRVLTLVAYYLPGYKAGGPLRTIHNMVLRLSYDFEFLIISRDRDKGDTRSYSDVMIDDWNELDNAMVFYGSKRILNLFGLKSLLRNTHYDIVYLNSFFDPILTFIPLLLRRFSLTPKVTYVIAPRGEFSTGAISLKVVKKRIYMQISKALGLYDGLHWQASSEFEAEDISREFGIQAENIYIAPDLPKMRQTENEVLSKPQVRKPGPLRIVFLSRISPIKNLAYLLRVLKDVTHTVDFTIYGPIENKDYWLMCERLITE